MKLTFLPASIFLSLKLWTHKNVKKTLSKICYQSISHHQGPHPLPTEILTPLHKVLRRELQILLPNQEEFLDQKGDDLSILALSSINEAIESYCGITNVHAPFFNLSNEMNHRIRDRRKQLLVKHSKGYEGVKDVEQDIEKSRKEWVRVVLGRDAAKDYKFGEVHHIMTKLGDAKKEKERTRKRESRKKFVNALFRDLNGILVPWKQASC